MLSVALLSIQAPVLKSSTLPEARPRAAPETVRRGDRRAAPGSGGFRPWGLAVSVLKLRVVFFVFCNPFSICMTGKGVADGKGLGFWNGFRV